MATVKGTDGFSPDYDEEAFWKTWSVNEIWTGGAGKDRWVPKVKDHVCDPETFETWIVDHLDPVSLIPTLRAIKPAGLTFEVTDEDVLFGVGPGAQPETYRAFLNDTVFPHTMSLDPRWMPKGTFVSYVKVFLGTDTSPQGTVISKVYDASGNFISNNVSLEMVALNTHTNYAVKIPRRFNVTEKHVDAERVTAVAYADDGHVIERRGFLVENTDTIADITASLKYVTEISLESIWLSETSADQLNYPLNIPMDALNLYGVVHYSEGPPLRLPVDGTKFSMLGLEGRLSTVVGQPHDLVLRYALSKGEQAYASGGVNNAYITKPYKIVTTNPNSSIAVKLFGYPVWEGDAVGYKMKWFLLNLSRNVYFDVTDYVRFMDNTGAYDPKLYGYLQRKAVALNLRDVSPTFIPFVHTQVVDIVLEQPANNDQEPNWTVGTESSDTYPRFGTKVWGRKVGLLVNFAAGNTSVDEWLDHYYYKTRPLIGPSETKALYPTHFAVTVNGVTTEWPISNWNADLALASTIPALSTAVIRFFKRVPSGDIHLSYAAALIKQY